MAGKLPNRRYELRTAQAVRTRPRGQRDQARRCRRPGRRWPDGQRQDPAQGAGRLAPHDHEAVLVRRASSSVRRWPNGSWWQRPRPRPRSAVNQPTVESSPMVTAVPWRLPWKSPGDVPAGQMGVAGGGGDDVLPAVLLVDAVGLDPHGERVGATGGEGGRLPAVGVQGGDDALGHDVLVVEGRRGRQAHDADRHPDERPGRRPARRRGRAGRGSDAAGSWCRAGP